MSKISFFIVITTLLISNPSLWADEEDKPVIESESSPSSQLALKKEAAQDKSTDDKPKKGVSKSQKSKKKSKKKTSNNSTEDDDDDDNDHDNAADNNDCERNDDDDDDNDDDAADDRDMDKEDKKKEVRPARIGNFSLPTSQQPAALFGFGGNIIDKHEVQIYLFADALKGPRKLVTDVIPNVTFGITDNLSIQFNIPFSPIMREDCGKSSGLEDWFIQVEYAFYNKKTWCYEDQATVLASVIFPSGSASLNNPNTGLGAPSFFIGGTYYHVLVDWFMFTNQGVNLTTSNHGTKYGEQFLYQFGLGRNFPSPEGWIYAWMVEIDGQYNKRNRIRGKIDHNSGGNIVFVTPSLWVSNKNFLLQFGVSGIVNQNLFGKQNKFDYVVNLNAGWSFY